MGFADSGDRHTAKIQKLAETDPSLISTTLWSPEIGVHRVAWNSAKGLGSAGWLVSGTASGLGRVEWVEGKFVGERVPWMV